MDNIVIQIISVMILITVITTASMYSRKLEEFFSKTKTKNERKKTKKIAEKAAKTTRKNKKERDIEERTTHLETEQKERDLEKQLEAKARSELSGLSDIED